MSSTEAVQNPIPILQQKKADMTTNPFINDSVTHEQDNQVNETNEVNDQNIVKKSKKNKYTVGFMKFNTEFSNSVMGFFDDIYEKPEDKKWQEHIVYIVKKDNRHNYLGVLLIFVIMFMILVN